MLVISIAGLFFGAEARAARSSPGLNGLVGEQAPPPSRRSWPPRTALAAVARPTIAFGILMVGATSAFAELKSSLDDIWHARPRAGAGWKTLLRARMLSFTIVLALAFMLLVSLVVNAALDVMDRFWGALWTHLLVRPGGGRHLHGVLVRRGHGPVRGDLQDAAERPHAWRDVTMGAIITALPLAVGKRLIGLYLGNSAVASSYGAAGSVVALMLWVYYSAQIFFFGPS